MHVKRRMLLALFLGVAALPATARAVPVDPNQVIPLKQPGGGTLSAHPYGDEWEHGLQTTSGYTIARNSKTGRWEYAAKQPDGGLRAGASA